MIDHARRLHLRFLAPLIPPFKIPGTFDPLNTNSDAATKSFVLTVDPINTMATTSTSFEKDHPRVSVLDIVIASVVGGFTTWILADQQNWMDGGRAVTLSTAGAVVFFTIGFICVPLSLLALVLSVPSTLLSRPKRVPRLLYSVSVSFLLGIAIFLSLSICVFTIPSPIFEFLTE